ncbi:MAG: hypothetical protein K2X03_02500 [Bryobacteraceae bacterium]|nr:hypothetical protein [Bryobacteraceae bacterium]
MSTIWRIRIERTLRCGEIAGLYATTVLLIVVEFCFVYWLHRIPRQDAADTPPAFIAMPLWYQRPRFEVTLLLTIVAGLLFTICRALWDLRWKRTNVESLEQVMQFAKQRVRTAVSVVALAGCELALVTWLRS